MKEEAFFLAYHLHWSYAEIMAMSTDDRWNFVRLLIDQLEKEKEAMQQSRSR